MWDILGASWDGTLVVSPRVTGMLLNAHVCGVSYGLLIVVRNSNSRGILLVSPLDPQDPVEFSC